MRPQKSKIFRTRKVFWCLHQSNRYGCRHRRNTLRLRCQAKARFVRMLTSVEWNCGDCT